MSVTDVDRNPAHLWPEFRRRLEQAHAAAEIRIKAELGISDEFSYAETLRSQARQTWLFGSGRSRPGPVLSWIRSPRFHGIGMAADQLFKRLGYKVPHRAWEILREEALRVGLANPAWAKGDYGHVQWNPTDKASLSKAASWVRAGFPAQPVVPKPARPDDVRVFVNGELLSDADGFLRDGRTWVWVRAVADDLRIAIPEVEQDRALLVATDWEADDAQGAEKHEAWVSLLNEGGKGFVPLKALEPFARTLTWDAETRTAKIWD